MDIQRLEAKIQENRRNDVTCVYSCYDVIKRAKADSPGSRVQDSYYIEISIDAAQNNFSVYEKKITTFGGQDSSKTIVTTHKKFLLSLTVSKTSQSGWSWMLSPRN